MLPNHSSTEEAYDVFNYNETYEDSENISSFYVPYGQRPETYIMPAVFGVIFIVGVAGNISLISIILLNRKLRNAPNIYIVSLAIGDFLVVSLSMPIVCSIYVLDSWPFGVVFCKCSLFVRNLSVGVTVFTLTALSFDRYSAIVTPFKRAARDSWISTALKALLLWIFAVMLSLPDAYTAEVEEFLVGKNLTVYVCKPFTTNLLANYNVYVKMNVLCKFLIFYLMPLLLIAFVYAMIARSLIQSVEGVPVANEDRKRSINSRKKVAKIVLCFVIIFALCFLPNHIFMLWFYFNPHSLEQYNDFWNILRMVGFTLCFANSCVNPIALYCLSKDFRKYYNRYLFRCFRRRGSSEIKTYRSYLGLSKYPMSSVGRTDTFLITSAVHFNKCADETKL